MGRHSGSWLGQPLQGGGTALARHDHRLQTTGICVGDIVRGQAAKGEGGHCQLHDHAHLGQPGAMVLENRQAPVSVGKGTCSKE